MKALRITIFSAVVLGVTLACGGDSTGPGGQVPESGSLKFDYSGDLSGTFSVSGTVPSGGGPGSYAAAHRDTNRGQMGVAAFQAKGASRLDQVIILFGGTETGRYEVDDKCEGDCVTMMFYFAVDSKVGTGTETRIFIATSGTVDVTEATSRVLKGSFRGTASEISGEGGEIQITNGTFSAPVVLTAPPNTAAAPVTTPGIVPPTAPQYAME